LKDDPGLFQCISEAYDEACPVDSGSPSYSI
jgi:hypothetical protein